MSFDDKLSLRDVLSPYFPRLQSLSVKMSAQPFAEFIVSSPIHFACLDSLVLNFRLEDPFQGFVHPPTQAAHVL